MNSSGSNRPLQGVMYVASGEKHVRAALTSARSVRKMSPDLPIHFFVDNPDLVHSSQAAPLSSITSVTKLENPHRRSKVECFDRTPFERTLFLDSDTMVLSEIDDVFAPLEKYDIAMTHAHLRASPRTPQWRMQLPTSFPQFNSGVVCYRRNSAIWRLFADWKREFDAAGFKRDQIVLRELLWLSDVQLYVLPPEFNVRQMKYIHLWSAREARPRILHHPSVYGRVPFRRSVAKFADFWRGRLQYSVGFSSARARSAFSSVQL